MSRINILAEATHKCKHFFADFASFFAGFLQVFCVFTPFPRFLPSSVHGHFFLLFSALSSPDGRSPYISGGNLPRHARFPTHGFRRDAVSLILRYLQLQNSIAGPCIALLSFSASLLFSNFLAYICFLPRKPADKCFCFLFHSFISFFRLCFCISRFSESYVPGLFPGSHRSLQAPLLRSPDAQVPPRYLRAG